MSPTVIRSGHFVIHVNEGEKLPNVLDASTASNNKSSVFSDRARMIQQSALALQQCITEKLHIHCSSLRDAVFHLKRKTDLSNAALQKVTTSQLGRFLDWTCVE